jgi:hypothetical protein
MMHFNLILIIYFFLCFWGVSTETKRARRLQGEKILSLFVTGSPDTLDKQTTFVRNICPQLERRANEHGLGFRVVAPHLGELWDASEIRPLDSTTRLIRALMECNFFVAFVGNVYGECNVLIFSASA